MGSTEDRNSVMNLGRVVVTGATGFIGSRLVTRLLELGARVRVLVRAGREDALSDTEPQEIHYGDLRDPDSLVGLCKDSDLVFHLAATQSFGLSESQFLDINVGGTERLAREAVSDGVRRFVLVSSGGVHANDSGLPVAEDAPIVPSSLYFDSKIRAEAVARHVFRDRPDHLTIIRPGAVYGPGCRRLLKLFKSISRGYFVMIGPGTRRIQPSYIDDVVDGLVLSTMDSAAGKAFLLAGPEACSLWEWVRAIAGAAKVAPPRWTVPLGPVSAAAVVCEALCKPIGVTPHLNRRRLGYFQHHRSYDLSRARKVLGYDPQVTIETGPPLTIDWYKNQGWL